MALENARVSRLFGSHSYEELMGNWNLAPPIVQKLKLLNNEKVFAGCMQRFIILRLIEESIFTSLGVC